LSRGGDGTNGAQAVEEKILVVGIQGSETDEGARESLEEMKLLARTAGFEVVGEVLQRRDSIHPAQFVGRGKAEEIRAAVEANGADAVLFDTELNPRQVRNLERITGARIQDRSELILYIFAQRARTSQAKLQVELARLEYSLPRLRRMWTHLSRTEGRVGIRAGSGEKQLEEDLRAARKRITDLKRALRDLEGRKRREVAHREELFNVSLVGYTNAGKSTLMNRLTASEALVENKLFATLDTMTRIWELPGNRRVLLSDTVGFLRNLPHHLIASFHATLEEAATADLLLHVVDASHRNAPAQILAVEEVLDEIGAAGKPTLLVLNKIDRVESPLEFRILRRELPEHVAVSATRGLGIRRLERKVVETIDRWREDFDVTVPASEGRLLSKLSRHGTVLSKVEPEEGYFRVRVRLGRADAGRLRKEFEGNGIRFERVGAADGEAIDDARS